MFKYFGHLLDCLYDKNTKTENYMYLIEVSNVTKCDTLNRSERYMSFSKLSCCRRQIQEMLL